jgi:RNase P/RNase MRP subunit p29
MTIDPRYLIYHDLIGLNAYIKPKSKPSKLGFSDIGIIIDETRSMLITQKKKMIKKYVKKDHVFRFKLAEGILEVDGSKIVGIPVNRLRSLKKKKWLKK